MATKTGKTSLFKLPNGLTAQILPLSHAELKAIAEGSRKIGERCGWLLGDQDCDRSEYPVAKIQVGNEHFYLVYRPLACWEIELFKKFLRTQPKKTMCWLLFAFYDKTAYPFYHRIARLLLETCVTGLPPKIGVLTFNDNILEYKDVLGLTLAPPSRIKPKIF
jgi:hypothetical protein